MLDIIQNREGGFELQNGPRKIILSFNDVSWLYDGDFYDIEEFDIQKAKKYYKIK